MAGRPREFDRTEALQKAMLLFWERGYEGTSIGDLSAALAIGKPSLYAAFGNKETLFLEALQLYEDTYGCFSQADLDDAPTAHAAFVMTLRRNAASQLNAGAPPGCFIVLSATVGTPQNADVRAHLTRRRQATRDRLAARLARGIADGDVPETADPQAVATFYATVINGLAIEARDGAGQAELDRIVSGALAAWDSLVGQ
ncbi:TetR/AcrR family transcriptional regulator [Devosia ginsengisoli]|uniref:TetR/AcrR family transcriptional regulator n=1 Tax=Devosia ginsengisoli TaxID=400770 RepID=A0A5B8LV67_9HYPH|nr:TetR/AcrR family transcriptional regulator [Devosia ginsengisoli]QDZ11739.1 TetR/AcrR family transcriptional regulator [Devosia ginsengisoli]